MKKNKKIPTLWEPGERKKCVFLYPGWKTEFFQRVTSFHTQKTNKSHF